MNKCVLFFFFLIAGTVNSFAQPDYREVAENSYGSSLMYLEKEKLNEALAGFLLSINYSKEFTDLYCKGNYEAGKTYRLLGNYTNALQHLNTAKNNLENNDLLLSTVLDEITLSLIMSGDLKGASQSNQQSLALKNKLSNPDISLNYRFSGLILLQQRRFPDAGHYFDKAIEVAGKQEDQVLLAKLNHDKGLWANALGDYETALKYYRKALNEFKEIQGQKLNTGLTLSAMASSFFNQGFPGKASVYYEDAINLLVEVFGDNHFSLIPVYSGLGFAFLDLNESDLAQEHLEHAARLSTEVLGNSHYRTLSTRLDLARFVISKGDTKTGIESVKAVFVDLPTDRGFQDKMIEFRGLKLIAQANTLAFDQNGEETSLLLAREYVTLAMDFLQAVISGYFAEKDRLLLLEAHNSIYDLALAIERRFFEVPGQARQSTENAFLIVERGKAQVLKGMIIPYEASGEFSISEEYDRLVYNHRLLSARIARLSTEDDKYASLRDSILTTEARLQGYSLPEKKTTSSFSSDEFRKYISEETALLSYYLQDSIYHIIYLDRERIDWLTYPADVEFMTDIRVKAPPKMKVFGSIFGKKESKIESFPTQITDVQPQFPLTSAINYYQKGIRKMDKSLFIKSSISLYNKLIFPVESYLQDKEHLLIIPHGPLHMVPFEGFLTKSVKEQKLPKYSKMSYLLQDFDISYHYSAELLALIEEREKVQTPEDRYSFIGFAPVFNDTLRTGFVWDSREFLRDTAYYVRYSNMDEIAVNNRQFKELRYSEQEVVNIAKLFARDGKNSQVFLHGKATETNLKKRAIHSKILHIASHSFVDYINPESTGIAFANANNESEDGILYQPESYTLELSADLVVLSSCESGMGALSEGEGIMSLTRGLIYSGADNTLISLWRVPDYFTSEFMVDFYRKYLTRDENLSEALRSAKLKALSNEKTAAPRNWCSFILIGQ